MTDSEKIKRLEKRYNCKIISQLENTLLIEREGFQYLCKRGGISKLRFSLSSMTKDSYLKYLNNNLLKNTAISADKIEDKRVLFINNETGESCWQPKYSLSLSRIISLTTKSNKYLMLIKDKLGNKYDYSKVKIIGRKDKITIGCPIHGDFEVVVDNIISGNQAGCPKCSFTEKRFGKQGFVNNCTRNNRIPILYVILFCNENEEHFIKIGISSRSVEDRIKEIPYNAREVIAFSGEAEDVYEMEQFLHKKYGRFLYIPQRKFNGRFECYYIENLQNLKDKILEDCKKILKVL